MSSPSELTDSHPSAEQPESRRNSDRRRRVLLTGATGYVGGRLRRELESRGVDLRCMARRPENLVGRVDGKTQVVQGDVLAPETLEGVFDGIDTAYYLIHSMGVGEGFEADDRRAAENFAHAAWRAGVRRIVYLGGLGNDEDDLSSHLRSRHEVGQILKRDSGAQVIEFRASIIIGSGSLSFELVRALVRKLPVMIWPKWVSTKASPIAIRDVLAYLLEALELPDGPSKIYEIGGPEAVSYGGIMEEYARQRGLRRFTIRVPFLSPRISSLWLGLVTPVYARIGRKLVEGLVNPTVVSDDAADRDFKVKPCGVREAIARAIEKENREMVETRWSDALSSSGRIAKWGGVSFGNRLLDARQVDVALPPACAFAPIVRLGGDSGYYYADWLWRVRGWMDLVVGGVGLRRGRRHSRKLRVGDAVDFWRVEVFEPDHRLRLRAEMKLPGRGWLEYEVNPKPGGGATIHQTAEFDPVGLFGLVYWYSVWPLHQFVFKGMLRGVVREAHALCLDQKPGDDQTPAAGSLAETAAESVPEEAGGRV
ncbi:SDR family oxidoreductase [Roseiconus nitratireducens]|uniref:SDR family oxidoreductase n=1 Tax=Roseiconus nitratireducens TaxID=2605748 RepID=A0A5M6D580_9BACT|nr:SDR family oxidoreductase [Roseiconus nitratireducens]KAA5542651.1 SDR family oxidoreductase [Roseiconus nitratireducens]